MPPGMIEAPNRHSELTDTLLRDGGCVFVAVDDCLMSNDVSRMDWKLFCVAADDEGSLIQTKSFMPSGVVQPQTPYLKFTDTFV
jgi:hypothetical protein